MIIIKTEPHNKPITKYEDLYENLICYLRNGEECVTMVSSNGEASKTILVNVRTMKYYSRYTTNLDYIGNNALDIMRVENSEGKILYFSGRREISKAEILYLDPGTLLRIDNKYKVFCPTLHCDKCPYSKTCNDVFDVYSRTEDYLHVNRYIDLCEIYKAKTIQFIYRYDLHTDLPKDSLKGLQEKIDGIRNITTELKPENEKISDLKYGVGQFLKVRYDLKTDNTHYGRYSVNTPMKHLGGKIVTITRRSDSFYRIKEDNETYAWTDEMFYPPEYIFEKEDEIKKETLVEVKNKDKDKDFQVGKEG